MVEKVARAICAKLFEDPQNYWGEEPIAEAVETHWHYYIEEAKLAIAAMDDRIKALEDQVKRCADFLENLPHQGALEGPTAFMIRQCRELLITE